MSRKVAIESTAEAYLELLAARGVEYLFANAGTDFAPLIEAYAKRFATGQALPRPITVPHEVPAVAMAHGDCGRDLARQSIRDGSMLRQARQGNEADNVRSG